MSDFKPILRFLIMSDVHIHENKDCRELVRLDKGMKDAYAYADSQEYKPLDAIFVVGDFANSGKETEMLNFKEVFDANIRPETYYYFTVASHEYGSGIEETHERMRRIFKMEPDLHKVIKGYHFIMVTPDHGCRFEQPQKAYAAAELKKAFDDDADKPIFFFQHPHVTGTVTGSVYWGEDDLTPILMNFPQVIDFSGHSHAPVNDPRSIHQRHFTCLGTGSLSYFELDEFDKYYYTFPEDKEKQAQFLIAEVDADNRVLIRAFDILTGKFFPCDRLIEPPFEPENFRYTDERYNTTVRPYFEDNAGISTVKTAEGLLVTFDQAKIDEDMIDDYKLTIRRASDNKIVRQICAWSHYYLMEMPDTVTIPVFGLDAGRYTAEVQAQGFWNNKSVNKLRTEFSI
ncbi:MAG: metallophosphoesterase [Clostridia bacterium]|nr:metallophosphoesterase [Clostridia bacterium]